MNAADCVNDRHSCGKLSRPHSREANTDIADAINHQNIQLVTRNAEMMGCRISGIYNVMKRGSDTRAVDVTKETECAGLSFARYDCRRYGMEG